MNFKIVDGNPIDYEEVKKDYLNGIVSKALCKKHNIGTSQYLRILKRFREEGVIGKGRIYRNGVTNPKWYRTTTSSNGTKSYEVRRMFNTKMYTFGRFKTEEEAQARVEELKSNGWDGLE
ncbi:MAG: hypothetical protein IJP99_10685 [Methanobrevibacter sp.]|nr:hypothetical protein [Methanobrevibacter sp.]MBR0059784.1 hypothetical protein [Methanobrevibacter sp.]